jgi:hypothetical protein
MTPRLRRSLVGRVVTVLFVASVAAGGLAAQSTVADADVLSWAPGITVPSPVNAGSEPGAVVNSISCPSSGNCTAIGSYQDASGETQGLLATESAGRWTTSIAAQLPPNFDVVNPDVSLTSVSCASVGNCTAVGSYIDVNGLTQGLLLTETSGTWGTGREVIHPLGVSVAGNPRIDLTSVSCATATNCVAVGSYIDSVNQPEGLLQTEINGTWSQTEKNGHWSYTGAEAGVPGDAATEPKVALTSVSCGAVGRCVAVGSYSNSSHEQEGLLLTGTVSSGVWTFTPTAAGLPPGAATSPVVSLNSVSCKAAGECSAVGSYADSGHRQQGLLLTQTGGSWQAGSEATLPSDASTNPGVSLTSISCSSAGYCDAVGDYYTGSGNLQGLMLTASGGSWSTGAEPTIPADAGSAVFVTLSSVSCAAASNCAATGNYADDSFSLHPLLLSQSADGTWSAGVEPAVPYPNTSPDANAESVSCAPGGGCTAIADYTDAANGQLASATNGTLTTPASPALSLSAPPAATESGIAFPANDFAASLSGGANASGAVTFRVFGPQDSPPSSCAEGGTTIGAATVSGNGSYGPTQGFTPAAPGVYWWYASYGGDLGNASATSACGASMDETVVQTPALTLGAPSTTGLGATVAQSTVSALLSDATTDASGTVAVSVFGPETLPPTDCTVGGIPVGSASVQGNGSFNPGSGFTPASVGDYWWYASYSGDPSNPATASGCGSQMAETVVKADTTLSVNSAVSTATVGVPVTSPISASLHGGVGESGTVTFSVFGPQPSPPAACGSPTSLAGSATVQNDGAYVPKASFTASAAGTYWWYASYSGDSTNAPAASACGAQMPETVVSAPPAPPVIAPAVPAVTTTTPTSAPPTVATARILKVTTSGNLLKVTLTCHAASHQSCAGALKATTTEARSASTKQKKRASHAKPVPERVVTIATVTFKVGGGTSRQVSIRLNKLGMGLLASRRKLSARLELHQERTTLSRTVTLRLPASKGHRRA